jgi:hypothetical protein
LQQQLQFLPPHPLQLPYFDLLPSLHQPQLRLLQQGI